MIKDIRTGATGSSPSLLTLMGGNVYFVANDGTGPALWTTDGTDTNTVMVKDLDPSGTATAISSLVVAGTKLFIVGGDATTGAELWVSDGTTLGTVLVKDIRPGSSASSIGNMVVWGTDVYFTANDGNGVKLWKSDGTTVGTTAIQMSDNRNYTAGAPFLLGSTLLFSADDGTYGNELWGIK